MGKMHPNLNKEKKLFHKCNYNCVIIIITILFSQLTCSQSSIVSSGSGNGDSDFYDFSTEPPDIVEIFNPNEWTSRAVVAQQVDIQAIKLVTQVKLRYARTRVNINLRNQHDRGHQADFKIILPENAFFTMFQMKKGGSPKTYPAKIVKKNVARNILHFASTKTNGTVSAGYIELSSRDVNTGLPIYSLKFTVAARETIQAFLVYERQLERVSNIYSDKIHIFPSNPFFNSSTVGLVEFCVNVEELEGITSLQCSNKTEETFPNCTSRPRKFRKRNGKRYKFFELNYRNRDISVNHLKSQPFEFAYELEHQNETTTAVVISQHNGNYYFVHLFVPENLPPTRKHILFLLDISDSMHGKKLEQLQWSMIEILDDLGPQDYFNIVAFSNDITMWSKFRGDMRKCPFPFPATTDFKDSAIQFIQEGLVAHGTTNIYLGLSTAFDLIRLFSPFSNDTCPQLQNIKSPKMLRDKVTSKLPKNIESMIFFLSDGTPTSGPTDTQNLLKYFHKLNHGNDQFSPIQIHTVAYGEDADVQFLKSLSKLNGGVTKIIREESAAGLELANFYQEISSQILSNLTTAVSAVKDSNGTEVSSPIKMASSPVTVIKGGEVLTAGQLFPEKSENYLNFNWSTEGQGKNGRLAYYNSPIYDCTTLDVSIGKCVDRIDFYLERLQAYQLLNKLMERDKMVEDGYLCPKGYHDNFQDLKMERLRSEDYDEDVDCFNNFKEQAVKLALKHGFVTPYTSFILTTEQVDNGLTIGDRISTDSSDEASIEIGETPKNPEIKEKLILMGSVSMSDDLSDKPKMASQFVLESLPEVVPIPERQIGEMPEKFEQDSRINPREISLLGGMGFLNSLNLNLNLSSNRFHNITNENESKLKLFTKSMRDFAVKLFKKVFNIKENSGN